MSPIEKACELLRQGRLVAFPTETVYGLGADATNQTAVERIFSAKGRPSTNPLIVHIADVEIAKRYAVVWPEAAENLAKRFWPGPLTLVLPKRDVIVSNVTAGRATVGLRVPRHPLALELLGKFDGAVAAPSANRSSHLSPTRAEHVRQELGDAVDLILDGGPCEVGIESTVLDLSGEHATVLRPGAVTREQIAEVIGPVRMYAGFVDENQAALSPGQQERHYSPRTPTYRFESAELETVLKIHISSKQRIVLVLRKKAAFDIPFDTIVMPADPLSCAARLYATLRELDDQGYWHILIEMPVDEPRWVAVRDRLWRAARPVAELI